MTNANPTLKRTPHPGIYRKTNGRFVVRYRDGERVRSRTFDALADARIFKNERDAAKRERALRDSIEAVDDAAANWLDKLHVRIERLEERVAALEAR
jgi:hypothetical protein